MEAVRSKVTRTSAAYLETRLISGLKRGGEKSRCFVTPGHLNNCSTLQKCPFRKQALALPYTEIPCTVYIQIMTDFMQMHIEVQCLAINIFGNAYMQVSMWMDGWLRRGGGGERDRWYLYLNIDPYTCTTLRHTLHSFYRNSAVRRWFGILNKILCILRIIIHLLRIIFLLLYIWSHSHSHLRRLPT